MQKFIRSLVCRTSVLALALSLLAGCQVLPEAKVDPTRHFVLSGPVSTDAAVANPAGRYQLGLRAIEVAGYLYNHRDMAVRTGANELRFEEFNRWAEPLETGINRVLKQRLLSMAVVGGVVNYPFPVELKRDYDVVIRVLNCEGAMSADGRPVARFVAAYDIIAAGAGGQVVVRRTFTAPEQGWNGKDFGALAGALSEAVAHLSEDIAANLPK
jgi:hypothetical protein